MMDSKKSTNKNNLDKKRELLELLDAKDRIQKDKTLENWVPSLLQEHFVLDTHKIRVIGGATRSGKSDAAAVDMSIRSTGVIPKVLQDKYPKQLIRTGDYWASGLDFNAGRDVIFPKLDSFIPTRYQEFYHKSDRVFTLKSGIHIGQKSADSGRAKYGGTSRYGIWMDEEHPNDIWDECYDRTSDCEGCLTMTFLPIKGLTWAYTSLYVNASQYISTINIHGMEEKEGAVHTPEEIKKLKERKLVIRTNTSSNADPDIIFYEMSVYDNIYIPDVEIYRREKKYKNDPSAYRARVLGRFTKITGNNVFPVEVLQKRQVNCVQTYKRGDIVNGVFKENLQGKLTIFKPLKELYNYNFAIGADPSEGLPEGDFSCAQIISYRTLEQWGIWHGKCSPEQFAGILIELGKFFNNAWLAPERNFHGLGVVNRIKDHFKYRRLFSEYDIPQQTINANYKSKDKRYGWLTTPKTKPIMIQDLSTYIRDNHIRLNDFNTIEELITFTYKNNGQTGAMGGCKDDRVTALAIALQVIKRVGIVRKTLKKPYSSVQVDPVTGY